MNIQKKVLKHKYKLSNNFFDVDVQKKHSDDQENIDNIYLYYYDLMNPYTLFPTILDVNLSKDLSKKSLENIIKNIGNDSVDAKIYNYNEDNDNIGSKINDINKLYKKYELNNTSKNDEIKIPRNFYSYEIIDELLNNFNAEYVTTAWLKCYEILEQYKFLDKVKHNTIEYFGICEQPGAFIFAINHYIKQKLNKNMSFIIQSLNDKFDNIAFKPEKNLYKKYNNKYDYGEDFTGDITNMDNIKYYRKTYYDKHIDIISADCGQSCNDYSQQEVNMEKLLISNILLAISLSSKGTTYFMKLFTIYENITVHMVYLLNNLFEKIILCRTLTTKPISGEIYCVCINFLYSKKELDPLVDILYKWYDKLDINKENNIGNLFKELFIDHVFNTYINNFNKLLYYRRILSINQLYFKLNNYKYTINNKNINNFIKSCVLRNVSYFIQLYKISSLNDKNKLVQHKYINKWNNSQKRITMETSIYKKLVYNVHTMFTNDQYLYYFIGKTFCIKYVYISVPIKVKNNIQNNKYIDIYESYNYKRYILYAHNISSYINSKLSLYYKNGYFLNTFKILKFIKNKYKNINTVYLDHYCLPINNDRMNKYYNKENIKKIKHYFKLNIIVNIYNDTEHYNKPKYAENSITVLHLLHSVETLISDKDIFIYYTKAILNHIKGIKKDTNLIVYCNGQLLKIQYMINLMSKYFKETEIIHPKYNISYYVYCIFSYKYDNSKSLINNDITKLKGNPCIFINDIKIYKQIYNYFDMFMTYKETQLNVFMLLIKGKLYDDAFYNDVYNIIKNIQIYNIIKFKNKYKIIVD
jgi:hypothetical protein